MDLHAAFASPHCCLCGLAERDKQRYFAALLNQQVTDRTVRAPKSNNASTGSLPASICAHPGVAWLHLPHYNPRLILS